jgi:hypothetical protein
VKAAPAALLLLLVLTACGEGGNGSPSPNPSPTPTPTPQDPCAAARAEELQAPSTTIASKNVGIDGSPRWRVLDALWTHRAARPQRVALEPPPPPAATSTDVGEIAVLRDEGDLILPPNSYDLKGVGLRFTRTAIGSYDVRTIDAAFRTAIGARISLTDDDTRRMDVPFGFPFYSNTERAAFVNSDGNITFGDGDNASTERNIARLLTGPPRVALFLADLDPSTAGGVFVTAAADQYVVTWCNVRGFESSDTTTAQVALLPDGTIEMKYASAITLSSAIVGLSPGSTANFRPVDLSAPGPTAGGTGAVGERFSASSELDTVALAQAFYRSHPDSYDQLVIWTDARVIQDAFAFESTVANEIRGIGLEIFDFSRDFGSAGRLRSYAVMDFLGKYPDDPGQRFFGENSTVSVLGQEVGHRWLAYLNFRDHNRQESDALLGRQRAHWSFFMDSDASVLEGNDIEDLGGGSFRTVGAVRRFSRLDQYAMGLVPVTEVPPFFYVADPLNLSEQKDRESAPDVGVTFNGTRRDVLIDDVVAIHGGRVPSSAESPRIHRQAFVYVVGAGRTPEAGHITKLDRIRREWEDFFAAATEGRMRAETRLRQ